MMLRSGALFVAIVVSILVGVLCSSLIFFSYITKARIQKDNRIKKLHLNAQSGINLLLSNSDVVAFNQERVFDLYAEGSDSVFLKKQHWGIFDVGVVKAFAGPDREERAFLYGYSPDKLGRSAIYLADENRPLAVSGKTIIRGDCFLPNGGKTGIRKEIVAGQSFWGDKMVDGEIYESKEELPELKKDIVQRIINIFTNPLQVFRADGNEVVSIVSDTLKRSFFQNPTVVYQSGAMTLENLYAEGNVIFCSDKSVTVKSTAKLNHVQIYAPYIYIDRQFQGRLQAFAGDSLRTGDCCVFFYPSVLGLIKKAGVPKKLFIEMGQENLFKGVVFSTVSGKDIERTFCRIGKNSQVEGQVYVVGHVQLEGEVWGNVSCCRFWTVADRKYDNYLFNAIIDAQKLSPYFVSSDLIYSDKIKKVAAWLH